MTEGHRLAIEALDRERPGWQLCIDVDTLDMYSLERCILGQIGLLVPGKFFETVERLVGWPERLPVGHPAEYFANFESKWKAYLTAYQHEHTKHTND